MCDTLRCRLIILRSRMLCRSHNILTVRHIAPQGDSDLLWAKAHEEPYTAHTIFYK